MQTQWPGASDANWPTRRLGRRSTTPLKQRIAKTSRGPLRARINVDIPFQTAQLSIGQCLRSMLGFSTAMQVRQASHAVNAILRQPLDSPVAGPWAQDASTDKLTAKG